MSSKKKDLKKTLEMYLADAAREVKELKFALDKAEKTDDYSDYDEACYSSWEYMDAQGRYLAAAVAEYLEGK